MNVQVGVKIIIKNLSNEYLFLRRSQSFNQGTLLWDIPGGRIESDEALGDALNRELREETGLSVQVASLIDAQDIFVAEKDIHVVRLTYLGEVKDERIGLSEEHSEYRWMTRDQASIEPIDPYVQAVMKKL